MEEGAGYRYMAAAGVMLCQCLVLFIVRESENIDLAVTACGIREIALLIAAVAARDEAIADVGRLDRDVEVWSRCHWLYDRLVCEDVLAACAMGWAHVSSVSGQEDTRYLIRE